MFKKNSLLEKRLGDISRNNAANAKEKSEKLKKEQSIERTDKDDIRNVLLKEERKRQSKQNKLSKKEKSEIQEIDNECDFNSIEDLDNNQKAIVAKNRERRKRRLTYKWSIVAIILLIVYFAFLIFGAIVTNYTYDTTGNVSAQIMSVKDIQEKAEYEDLVKYYYYARDWYEKTLVLDYRLSQASSGSDDYFSLAVEYEDMVDDIEVLSNKIAGASVPNKYSQVLESLKTWVGDELHVYLQKISIAITNNDTQAANDAVILKSKLYSDFSYLTATFISLSQGIKSIETKSLTEWSPEKYLKEKLGLIG